MTAHVYDDRNCELGEGPLWHPERGQLFWFDIIGKKLLSRDDTGPLDWAMDELTSAAGWVDKDTLMLVSESGFFRFDIATGKRERIADLERDNPVTRSNDGRANPYGGYWIGTMGKKAEDKAGAIYRYYRGEVRCLFPNLSITNAISFSPDGTTAYFADTDAQKIWLQRLEPKDGWPVGEPELFVDLKPAGVYPDGAVVDAAGHLWNAQWGAGRIAEYDANGSFVGAVAFPAARTTCPAFAGAGSSTLYCTTAMQGLTADERAANAAHGRTFFVEVAAKGQAEHRVVL